ncbi:hypothetical protein CB1_002301004 [Camelus ferus]|nr:hypothetical protein CB1_002301004 [Camelus ferus]
MELGGWQEVLEWNSSASLLQSEIRCPDDHILIPSGKSRRWMVCGLNRESDCPLWALQGEVQLTARRYQEKFTQYMAHVRNFARDLGGGHGPASTEGSGTRSTEGSGTRGMTDRGGKGMVLSGTSGFLCKDFYTMFDIVGRCHGAAVRAAWKNLLGKGGDDGSCGDDV